MRLTEYSLHHRSVVWFVLTLCLVGGVWAFSKMGKKEDSTFVLKSAVVSCSYDGATPFQVEELVAEPISRELQSMRRVKKVTSESHYGFAKIVVELEPSVRAEEVPQLWDELRRKVSNITPQLPSGVGAVRVNDDFGDVYGLYYALAADDGYSWSEIREWAQHIKRRLVPIVGVQKVALFGEQQPVVNVFITKSKLSSFSITPEMIAATIAQQNMVVSSGDIVAGEFLVRVLETGSYSSIDDIANQLLFAPDGKQYRLGDVARIEQDYATPPKALMSVDGHRAVGIGISTEAKADVVTIGKMVREELELIKSEMPLGLELEELYPEDTIAREANYSFMLNLLESVAIVVAILMLAMGLRSGIIIGGSLLLTIGGTMLLMYMLGEGINRTSLAGFIIAMGMLVDNAIVVIDNTLKALRRGGELRPSLIESADAPKWGLLAATLIAIISFLPLYLAPSSVAEIVKPLFVVIAISLLLSWLIALTGVPIFALRLLAESSTLSKAREPRWFESTLRQALHHRKAVVSGVVLLFAGSLVAMRFMPQNFFPQLAKPYFRAEVILPEGFDISSTQMVLERMSRWLRRQPRVVKVSSTAGASPLRYYLASSSFSSRANYGNLLIEVEDKSYTAQVKRHFDKFVADSLPDVWLRSSLFKLSPVPDATIEIGFVGSSVDTLLSLTSRVEQIMWQDKGAENIRNSWGNRLPTWQALYSPTKGQRIGVGRGRMAEWIRLATEGYTMGEYSRGDEFLPILLKDEDIGDYNLSNLQSLPIFSQGGKVYSIEQASSSFDFEYRIARIEQFNRERVMKAQCDPKDGVNTQQLFQRILERVQSEITLPEGYELRIFGEQESQEESNAALRDKLPLTLVLILFILLLLFGNYRDVGVILLMIPLIAVGVVVGLLLTRNSFDFFSLLGLLGLVGMNVKNGVILISSISERIASEDEPFEALVRATTSRLMPVSMASLTTILALVPLLFDSLFAGMAATIMGGLMMATLLTMVVLPVVYAMFYNIKEKK